MASLFEEMGGTYTLGADGMHYPNYDHGGSRIFRSCQAELS